MRRDASTRPGYPADVVARVLDAILAARAAAKRRVACIGLSGLQGSGKSTLAARLAALARAHGIACEVLSLDDFYFGRRERARLARERHPLFASRGVPGTHEVALLERTLAALARPIGAAPLRVPRFDKGRDTRLPPSRWRRVRRTPELVLLEGWCVGVPAQAAGALRVPVNALERDEDREGRWRRTANAELAGAYARAWRRLDALVLLQAPSFEVVERWRAEQERALLDRAAARAMKPAALRRFVAHFERISRHAVRSLPRVADVRVVLDASRHVVAIRVAGGRRKATA